MAHQYQAYSPQPERQSQSAYSQSQQHSFQAQPTELPSNTTIPSPPQPSTQSTTMAYEPHQQQYQQQQQQPMLEKAQPAQNGRHFGSKWSFGLFDCCSPISTCCLGCWCPCFQFGKTYDRDHGKGETSGCNAMCCLWYLAAQVGFHSCFQCVMRSQQREQFGIEGNMFKDYCASCWCSCCQVIQSEKESVVRITGVDPKTKVAYQPVNEMSYPA